MAKQYRCYNKVITRKGNVFLFQELFSLNNREVLVVAGEVEAGRCSPAFYEKSMAILRLSQLQRIQQICSLEDINLAELQEMLVGKLT